MMFHPHSDIHPLPCVLDEPRDNTALCYLAIWIEKLDQLGVEQHHREEAIFSLPTSQLHLKDTRVSP
jgi:hypothetical protein